MRLDNWNQPKKNLKKLHINRKKNTEIDQYDKSFDDDSSKLDHNLPGISNITSYYGILTIEILPLQTNQTTHRI